MSEVEIKKVEEQAAPVAATEEKPAVAEEKATARKSSIVNASVSPEDFDWDAFENDGTSSAEDRQAIEEAYDKTLSKIVENEVVEGEVTAVTKREVVVNIGGKSEGVIPVSEFRYNPELKAGDKVEVYVESVEDRKGQLVLSHRKARTLKSWDRVNQAYENDEIVKGFVKTRTKGGMIVDVFGIEAFLPGSQIDIKPIRDYDQYVNQTIDCKIVKINQEFRNVVVSHKALLEAEQEQRRAELISKLEKGQVLEGVVKNITHYGVFVDLGGVDGLIHITDLSWGRINNPEEVVSLDQKIKVVVLDFNEQQKRIALGLKQLTPHPWDNLNPDLKVGDKVKGKVILIADYGAFVEIEPGVEGLVHVSEMSWSPRLHSAQEFLKVGDEVEAQILSIDREARKISLGLKQLMRSCPIPGRTSARNILSAASTRQWCATSPTSACSQSLRTAWKDSSTSATSAGTRSSTLQRWSTPATPSMSRFSISTRPTTSSASESSSLPPTLGMRSRPSIL